MEKPNYPSEVGARHSDSRAGYAEWLALGAVTAGTVGAIIGMATCRKSVRTAESPMHDTPEPESLTAPHGDKLRGAVV